MHTEEGGTVGPISSLRLHSVEIWLYPNPLPQHNGLEPLLGLSHVLPEAFCNFFFVVFLHSYFCPCLGPCSSAVTPQRQG